MSKRWEYLTIQLKPSTWGFIKPEQVQEELTGQGRQGWELVSFAAPGHRAGTAAGVQARAGMTLASHVIRKRTSPRPRANDHEKQLCYWFHAKELGWGWSFPASWQGWLVFALYIASIVAARYWLMPAHVGRFLLTVGVLSLLLIGICFAKGEPQHD